MSPIFIAGPCVIESVELLDTVAARLVEINKTLGTDIIFKASFDKANRTSIHSFRGPGIDRGLEMLDDVKQKYMTAHQELLEYDEALKKTEKQLEERKEQNKTFIKLLHQSEFEETAEDVIKSVREASRGKKEMTIAEWKQLYKAVDELYPTFHETILKQSERLGEKEMQVMYLLRIGLSKHQIMNVTNLARVTIWRWEKKFEWVLNEG